MQDERYSRFLEDAMNKIRGEKRGGFSLPWQKLRRKQWLELELADMSREFNTL
jgi:hypothetical protein